MGIETITVVGAAAIGRTAASLAARAGFRTILEDITGQMIDPAMAELGASLGADALQRVEPMTRIEDAAREADFVVEAVPEDMETKLEIFTVLDKSTRPEAILASTTSALSMTEIASITLRAERMLGMHFYPAAGGTALVELVRGLDTSDATMAASQDVAKRMGVASIVVRESAGFVLSRLRALQCNEAFALVREGVGSHEAVDQAMRLAGGHPQGPVEWAGEFGLDNLLQELERLEKAYGERYRPNQLLTQYVRAGRTGRRA